jgi:hypothetical protein
MHLAVAVVGTICVAVFGYTDPSQVGPMSFEKHVIIKKNNILRVKPKDIVQRLYNKKRRI